MADDEKTPEEQAPDEQPAAEQSTAEAPEEQAPAEQPTAEAPAAEAPEEQAPDEQPTAKAPTAEAREAAPAAEAAEDLEEDVEEDELTPRRRPEIPGADLEVDIVREGEEALRGEGLYGEYDEDEAAEGAPLTEEEDLAKPIADAAIDLAAGARYSATGKRKTAVARVILRPGDGTYLINGRSLDVFFPRATLQRNIRQPLETVGYETRMDVVASMHGGGVSAQAGALRHGISRALIEADPNLRSELKRRGFLTRDARVKERKKAGLKKARKRPQFSKR